MTDGMRREKSVSVHCWIQFEIYIIHRMQLWDPIDDFAYL